MSTQKFEIDTDLDDRLDEESNKEPKSQFQMATSNDDVQLSIPRRFYCHWKLPLDEIQYDENNKEIVDDYENGQCCFNHRIGLPTRKWEKDDGGADVIHVELTHFNRRTLQNYFRHRKYSKNKCRGDGTTELITVRWNIFKYGVMNTVKNRKAVVIPGTSSNLAHEISTRIKAICDTIPQIYKYGIPKAEAPEKFYFKTDGRIHLTSTVADAVRGHENIGDINEEEFAHWELINDRPVHYAAEGVHNKTGCHITHNTTPQGKANSYYEIVWSPDINSDFYKHVVNWREVVGLPVMKVEQLYPVGHIDDGVLKELRNQCLNQYETNDTYRTWYHTFEKSGVRVFWDNDKLIPIEELMDVPVPLLDINSIVRDSKEDRSHYDQELDNEFISSQNRAIGAFQEANIGKTDSMQNILDRFKEQRLA